MKISPQQVTLIDSMGSDLSVVNAARVSFSKESAWENEDEAWTSYRDMDADLIEVEIPNPDFVPVLSAADTKLIGYLAKNNHWTPFAHVFLSFRVKFPFFVAAQIDKHTVGVVSNSVSRRYVSDEPEFFMPETWRGKPVNAKQGSSDEIITHLQKGFIKWSPKLSGQEIGFEISKEVEAAYHHLLKLYESMIESGVAPEQARMILPLGAMTERIWSGSLAAFARIYKLRIDSHAQQETRFIAQEIAKQIPPELKISWAALTQ